MNTRTKIVATIGPERKICDPNSHLPATPASYDQMIECMFDAGVDVFRLNMSHRSQDGESELRFADSYRMVRYRWESQKKEVAILGDLQGPKIRIGTFFDDPNAEITLQAGRNNFVLQTRREVRGDDTQVSVLYEGRPLEGSSHITRGTRVWLGDGEALLEIRDISQDGALSCFIHSGGVIKGRRGVTFKDTSFELETFTRKDRDDLKFLMSVFGSDLTYVAFSFVSSAEDILKIKAFMAEEYRKILGTDADVSARLPGIIAKIETKQAVAAIDEILDVVDGVMIARGDLGMQLELEELAGVQKRIIHRCNVRGKLVITATQMLDSMERNPLPTRAEVTDVHNAILDGTDAVMLSGETSKGNYPVQAIRSMRVIASQAEVDYFQLTNAEDRFLNLLREVEKVFPEIQQRVAEKMQMYRAAGAQAFLDEYQNLDRLLKSQPMTDRVSHAACNLAIGIQAQAIMAPTISGHTARMVARFRPQCAIIGAAVNQLIARRLTLSFGVYPLNILNGYENNEAIFLKACELAKNIVVGRQNQIDVPLIRPGNLIVITAGYPLNRPGTTNLVKLHQVA